MNDEFRGWWLFPALRSTLSALHPGTLRPALRALRPALCALRPALRALSLCFVFVACTTTKTPPFAGPSWDSVPPLVLDALCSRLQSDAVATGAPLALVSTTRPLVTQQSMTALLNSTTGGKSTSARVLASLEEGNRSLPLLADRSACAWRPVALSDLSRYRDEMLVEVSAPLVHPFARRQAGLFARVTLGGEGASWYWITLVPSGDGWAVSGVSVLVQ